MRFSLATIVPLAALIVPGLSGTITARQPVAESTTIQGRNYNGSYAPWKPSWTWPGTDKHCPKDVPEYCPCLDDLRTARVWIQVPLPMAVQQMSMGACVRRQVTYEINCKDLCLAHDNCNSCQVYTLEEAAEQFVCALFEEIVDITTWEDDCEDDWVDDWVYYSSLYWNVYY
ncbi:hypothetical protein EDD85DRAFT_982602 [Armillaria nabsnona]|nr:hypothetical protein EDD85DRAFT_982602 [Armillaria nabsnona]